MTSNFHSQPITNIERVNSVTTVDFSRREPHLEEPVTNRKHLRRENSAGARVNTLGQNSPTSGLGGEVITLFPVLLSWEHCATGSQARRAFWPVHYLIVSNPVLVTPLAVAVSCTVVDVVTGLVKTVQLALELPAETVTVDDERFAAETPVKIFRVTTVSLARA
jgi:hypothetical protein